LKNIAYLTIICLFLPSVLQVPGFAIDKPLSPVKTIGDDRDDYSIFGLADALITENKAFLVHNTLEEIESCKGKVQLELIRTWGGDKEEDENKFFKTPFSIAVDTSNRLYISDHGANCIKIFNITGKYITAFGRKGRGPADLLLPSHITLDKNGDLWVFEQGGMRFQCFSPTYKSTKIIRIKAALVWIGAMSNSNLAVYNHRDTYSSRNLITIMDKKGKTVRQIGKYHDKSKNSVGSEWLQFTIDNSDNIYSGNQFTPVIRKYAPEGRMLMAVTFDTPYKIPVKIVLNKEGNEIERIEENNRGPNVKINKTTNGATVSSTYSKSNRRILAIGAITTDSKGRIYIVTRSRKPTEEEIKATLMMWTSKGGYDRRFVNFDLVENVDYNKLLVFNPNGKVIAETSLSTKCDRMYLYSNRLYIIDGKYNQRIIEYKVHFSNDGNKKPSSENKN
jgi:hypothetical protein